MYTKKRKTVCGIVSTKRKTLLLVFLENDRDDKLKASGVITFLQFKIWLIREIPPVFRQAGMRKQEQIDACSK